MRVCLFLLLVLGFGTVSAETRQSVRAQAMFRLGLLADGRALEGERQGGLNVGGRAAACAACHRRSGLGMTEGQVVVPPITGKFLFEPRTINLRDTSAPQRHAVPWTRMPYDDATLARAIRLGIDSSGRQLDALMPRYRLGAATMADLAAYLRQLSSGAARGVAEDTLHFATIVTPDVDPVDKRSVLEVMQHFFADKNAFIRGGSRAMSAQRQVEYRVTRRWQLHVWELTGSPQTWGEQLQRKIAAQPVFAAISGLGRSTWKPVHQFCEEAALPCLFPNIELPGGSAQDFYTVYFSRGVQLESDLILERLSRPGTQAGSDRIVQVYRPDDVGASAAEALRRSATEAGFAVQMQVLPAQADRVGDLIGALAGVRPDDTLVLWLRGRDLAALPEVVPDAGQILISGLMGGLEKAPLPRAWRKRASMTYPLDLPEQRKVRMNFPQSWYRVHNIEPAAARLQTDTYVACGILAEALSGMLDNFAPDYLLEQTEAMLSHRLNNGYYARLSLGPDQRIASKGGYFVRFTEAAGGGIAAEGDWIVP
jgi:hypothetical protein